MRTINTMPAVNHTFYRLLGDTPAAREATSVRPVAFPLRIPAGQMPRMALVNGGTPHAFSVSVPLVHESRTRSGKRVLRVVG